MILGNHFRGWFSNIFHLHSIMYLHCDESLMPHNSSAWSARNFLGITSSGVCVTSWLNVLQVTSWSFIKPVLFHCFSCARWLMIDYVNNIFIQEGRINWTFSFIWCARTLNLPSLYLWHLILLVFPIMYCINGTLAIQFRPWLLPRLLLSSITSKEREEFGSVANIKVTTLVPHQPSIFQYK